MRPDAKAPDVPTVFQGDPLEPFPVVSFPVGLM
jgi:hypothetical protein